MSLVWRSSYTDPLSSTLFDLLGTPYYVAPEVLRREYTEACDVWSIGVITYILLCGYPPFYGDNDAEIFMSVKAGEFDFPSPEWDDISNDARDFVTFLLQNSPDLRPTALKAIEHPWIVKHVPPATSDRVKILSNQSVRGTNFQKYLGMQKLKKAALVTIARNLTHKEVGSLEDVFRKVDRTGDGRVTLTDIHDSVLRGKIFIGLDIVFCSVG